VVSHPTDEDVLRPLLELLGEQERYQELLSLYETCETALADEDRQLDSRTQDIAEYFKSKQIRRPATVPNQASSKQGTRHLSPSQSLGLLEAGQGAQKEERQNSSSQAPAPPLDTAGTGNNTREKVSPSITVHFSDIPVFVEYSEVPDERTPVVMIPTPYLLERDMKDGMPSSHPHLSLEYRIVGSQDRERKTPPLIMSIGEMGRRAFSLTEESTASQSALSHALTVEQVILMLSVLEVGSNTMTYDPAKRATLQKLVAAGGIAALNQHMQIDPEPWQRLMMARGKPSLLNKATWDCFERLLGECWVLANGKELVVAEAILSSFLPEVLALPQKEGKVAFLASHGLRLQSILVHHRLQLTEKVKLCEQSVDYARRSKDATTLVAALIELAAAYEYNNRMDEWFETLQQALYFVPQALPIVQAPAYCKNARALASHKRMKEAEVYLHMGVDTFPSHPELDPIYMFVDSNIYTLSRDAGRARLEMHRVTDAYHAFETYKQLSSSEPIPERIRLEIVNGQAQTAILENDLDKYAQFLKDGLASAVAMGSQKRFDEFDRMVKENMPPEWFKHHTIQPIVEQYDLMQKKKDT